VSRIKGFNFSPEIRWNFLARARVTAFLSLLAIVVGQLCLPAPSLQAAEGDLVSITGLNISPLGDAAEASSGRHLVALQGTFTNTTNEAISELKLNLVSTPAIRSRSQLAELISDPTISRNLISSNFFATLRNVAPGGTKDWQITFVGEDVLKVNASGVYAFGVKPNLPGNNEATVVTTPWFFNADIKPTNVALVAPLTTRINHLANGEVKNLEKDLAEAQRLTNLILSESGSKISWLQDSALSSWVSQLSASSDSEIPIKLGDALADLTPNGFLPFGSTNLTALSLVDHQRDLLDALALTRSGAKDKPIFYAPTQGVADSKTITLLNQQNIRTIVSNEFLRGNARITTSAVTEADSNPVLVHDLAASSCLTSANEDATSFFKTETCLKSEIGMITAESPQKSRSIIVLAPTNWNISSQQLSKLIASLSDQSWVQITNLETVAALNSAGNYKISVKDFQSELTTLTIRQADALRIETGTLASVFADKNLVAGFNASRVLGFSELWESSGEATEFLSENLALVDTYLGAISIQGSSRITTPQESSDIPITIVNESDRNVSVSIGLTSTATSRFTAVPSELIQVNSGQRITIPVAITLIGAGVVDVQAQLIAPNGERFGEAKNMQISSAAYGQFARTLVWGAFGLLVLLALGNFVKRRKGKNQVSALES
jgi:hypothetical protein